MGYKQFDSLKEFMILQDKMGRFLEREEAVSGVWVPPADLYEAGDGIILFVELPGIDEKDVKIDLWENYLTVSGERRFKGREESYLCVERAYGPFQRTFRLPAMVEEDAVVAEFKNGVLKISMRKRKGPDHNGVRVSIS